MKSKHIFSVSCISLALWGCADFSENYFYEESFGINLNEYVDSYETSYTDGVLEIYNISPEDDLYKTAFENRNVQTTTDTLIGYKQKMYIPSKGSPIMFTNLGSIDGVFTQYILYIPAEKVMVFMYADSFGA